MHRSSPSFDYAQHGNEQQFTSLLRAVRLASTANATHPQPLHAYQSEKKIIKSGMCGMDRHHQTAGGCVSRLLEPFLKCAIKYGLPETVFNAPYTYSLFSRPQGELVRILALMRRRLRLPPLVPGIESAPGAHGLHTPGFYMIAFHFRRIPLGFEVCVCAFVQFQLPHNFPAPTFIFQSRFISSAHSLVSCIICDGALLSVPATRRHARR